LEKLSSRRAGLYTYRSKRTVVLKNIFPWRNPVHLQGLSSATAPCVALDCMFLYFVHGLVPPAILVQSLPTSCLDTCASMHVVLYIVHGLRGIMPSLAKTRRIYLQSPWGRQITNLHIPFQRIFGFTYLSKPHNSINTIGYRKRRDWDILLIYPCKPL